MPLENRLSRGDKGEVTARISILALTSLFVFTYRRDHN